MGVNDRLRYRRFSDVVRLDVPADPLPLVRGRPGRWPTFGLPADLGSQGLGSVEHPPPRVLLADAVGLGKPWRPGDLSELVLMMTMDRAESMDVPRVSLTTSSGPVTPREGLAEMAEPECKEVELPQLLLVRVAAIKRGTSRWSWTTITRREVGQPMLDSTARSEPRPVIAGRPLFKIVSSLRRRRRSGDSAAAASAWYSLS